MQLTIDDVTKSYGAVTALDGLSLEIPAGTTYGILGTNGAGKTTLFQLLVGHDRPDDGRLLVGNTDVADAGASMRRYVGYLPEHVGFPDRLTGREVLVFQARMRDIDPDSRVSNVLQTVGLSAADGDRAVTGYSNGMRRRLALAAALLPEPPVLVLDEPTAGLDPRGVADLQAILTRVRRRTDATVVITSHVLDEIERLCDRVAILHEGRVRAAGPLEDVVEGAESIVEIRPGSGTTASAVVSAVANLEGVTLVQPVPSTDGADSDRVGVRCPTRTVPTLFASLEPVDIAGASVTRTGLEAVFHEVTAEEGSA